MLTPAILKVDNSLPNAYLLGNRAGGRPTLNGRGLPPVLEGALGSNASSSRPASQHSFLALLHSTVMVT